MRVIIFLALLGTALAVPKSISRIVGGSPTTVQEYPYMSNMQYGFWGIWWFQACGGSLLTTTSVLSAAHCYFGDSASEWRVRLGTSFASSGGSEHTVSQLVLHQQYNPNTLDHDIAIVRLANPAVYSNSVQPASVAGSAYNLPDNTLVTTIGWGTTSSGGSSPEQLQHVDINIINQQLCAERYAYLKTQPGYQNWPDITDNMLCAGILNVGGKDACQGDSGGPLAHNKNVIVGVVSWGFQCADAFYPGVNARVSKYTQWISQNA
ncbi:trypsin, alkaline C isoform X2 [Spodoptera frugiperda]|uniref:trypsin n=1 Tax=Spodoptera frugiperda TaxID=7108 RepID=A0A9R0EAJ9_SPOFR|nr:trypsin, alkaline C isoform X2 [Spodoptera frugiperda]